MFYSPLTNELRDFPDREFIVPLSEPLNHRPNKSILPGTTLQIVYDSVSLKALQGCLRKYNFHLLQGWQPTELSPPLAWGRDIHTCLETYHKCRAHGLDFETSVHRVVRLAMLLGERLLSLDTSRTKETLVRSALWYLDNYKDDPLITALLPDGRPAVELSFMLPIFDIKVEPTDELPPLDFTDVVVYCGSTDKAIQAISQGRRLFGNVTNIAHLPLDVQQRILKSFFTITIHFSGHIDRVAHFDNEVFVVDYKSSKYALTSEWVSGFDMSTQFEGYYTAAQIMSSLPNSVFPSPPAGILVDGLQLGVNFTRFARFPLRYHPSTADEFLTNFEALVRCKAIPAATYGLYPREAESECNAYRRRDGLGGCEFRKVCKAPPAARERELEQGFVHSTWDPSQSR